MKRKISQYANCLPSQVAGGSYAQMQYFVADAKSDIAEMARFIERIARLNADAGEIGPGMLAQLVEDAKGILEC